MNYIRIIATILIVLTFPMTCLASIEINEDSFTNSATIYSDSTIYDRDQSIKLVYGLTRIISQGQFLTFSMNVSAMTKFPSNVKLLPIGMDIRFNEDPSQLYTAYSNDKQFRDFWISTVVTGNKEEHELFEKIRTAQVVEIRINYYGGSHYTFRVPDSVLTEWKEKVIGYTLPK